MNVDAELTRLFADERLTVPMRGGAVAAVVAGARRVRRRRVAIGTTCCALAAVACAGGLHALTTAHTSPTSVTTGTDPFLIGPDSHGGLRLGMTTAEAEATGLITATARPSTPPGCRTYGYAGDPAHAVLISATHGLVTLEARPGAHTPEGVGVGTTTTHLREVYAIDAPPLGEQAIPVPGAPGHLYRIVLRDGVVVGLSLELAAQDCHA